MRAIDAGSGFAAVDWELAERFGVKYVTQSGV